MSCLSPDLYAPYVEHGTGIFQPCASLRPLNEGVTLTGQMRKWGADTGKQRRASEISPCT